MPPRARAGAGFLAVLLAAVGCTDDRIITVDRDLTGEVPAAAAGFVGYYQAEGKRTTCGECHKGQQAAWAGTAHADAWATLANSGSMQPFCQGCHTVTQNGNQAENPGGYTTVQDARYHDVQCESCHGPGLEHVQTPDRTVPPLASMLAGTTEQVSGCGSCHSGDHYPFQEEWAASGHGVAVAYPAGRSGCAGCHAGEDVLKEWGVDTEYLEKGELDAAGQHMGITCAVCHDPHTKRGAGQLRFAIDVADEEQNLCMKCHHKRGKPDVTAASRGPHSPEGPLLLGYAGWWPPSMEVEGGKLVATHGSSSNARLCAGCHVNAAEIKDQAGATVAYTTGHTFQATPCVDASGVPTGGECGRPQQSFKGCVGGNCHGTEGAARTVLAVAETRLERLAEELDLLVKKIPAAEFNNNDGRYTTGEGAKFNVGLAGMTGTAVHNPFLMEALLLASIKQVKLDYGLPAQSDVSLVTTLGTH